MGKIAEYLAKEFFSVNCSTCYYVKRNKTRWTCQACRPNWSISKDRALELEQEILKENKNA